MQSIGNLKYAERLKNLGLTRLEKRTVRSDLIETFEIMNADYNINSDLFFILMMMF